MLFWKNKTSWKQPASIQKFRKFCWTKLTCKTTGWQTETFRYCIKMKLQLNTVQFLKTLHYFEHSICSIQKHLLVNKSFLRVRVNNWYECPIHDLVALWRKCVDHTKSFARRLCQNTPNKNILHSFCTIRRFWNHN